MKGRFLDAVIAAGREARSVALATDIKSGAQLLLTPAPAHAGGDRTEGDLGLDAEGLGAMRDALRADRNRLIETPGGRVFIQVFSPPRRCFVIGAVHVAQPLVQMLALPIAMQTDRLLLSHLGTNDELASYNLAA